MLASESRSSLRYWVDRFLTSVTMFVTSVTMLAASVTMVVASEDVMRGGGVLPK